MEKHLNVPANTEELAELKSGDYVYLTGTIYTARDAAHKRMYETLLDGKELPVDVKGQFIYYLGPTPAREVQKIKIINQNLLTKGNYFGKISKRHVNDGCN